MQYLKVFTDFVDTLEALGDAERGRLFTAMLEYARSGEIADLHGNERFLWPTAKQAIDRAAGEYDKMRERNKQNAQGRKHPQPDEPTGSESQPLEPSGIQDKDKDKDKDKENKESKRKGKPFTRPTADEVREYCRGAGIQINADAFVDYYESKGWKVGTAPMKDWKAAARGWAARDAERRPAAKKGMGADAPYKQTQLTDEELDALLIDLDHDFEEDGTNA